MPAINPNQWRFSVAPMMGWTDRHERTFLRALSGQARLYTEMIAEGALVHGQRERFLDFDQSQHPVALQLGGSDPSLMAQAARLGEEAGFDEININVGCPSERGTHRLFGAHLMKYPELVAEVFEAMQQAVKVPVTIKTRIGVDRDDAYEPFRAFIDRLALAGCRVFHIHARKAWLDGLSPKENRDVPPLRYDFVYRLKKERPDLVVTLNGGITTLAECLVHLQHVDGVMLGREAYHNPFLLSTVDQILFSSELPPISREDFLLKIEPYIGEELAKGTSLHALARHLLGLYQGQPGGRHWRRVLSEESVLDGAGLEVIHKAQQVLAETAELVKQSQLHRLKFFSGDAEVN